MGNINHPSHYNAGYPEVIDIIDSWGLCADFDAANVLKYFLRAPYKGKEEEDYRKAMWYLDRLYARDIGIYCDILCHNHMMSSPIRLRHKKINLNWFYVLDYEKEIRLHKVIEGWRLEDDRKEFIINFYYQNFNCEKCLKILDKIIDDVSEEISEDEDL
jgi:hypothetical protein